MNVRIIALSAALGLGLAAQATSAIAYDVHAPARPVLPLTPDDDLITGSIGGTDRGRRPGACAPNSASEGNANQQTRPVMQYGQTSGGSRC
ncbi:hypothetical protein [Methylobacterium nigriterrae]|uniref:hypothetical protein n=1 Tax=Methylobacterium nigriterrae TaxID=3127512 RepID=UPI0030137567